MKDILSRSIDNRGLCLMKLCTKNSSKDAIFLKILRKQKKSIWVFLNTTYSKNITSFQVFQ